jgi:multimeric flavodoxin WrbA
MIRPGLSSFDGEVKIKGPKGITHFNYQEKGDNYLRSGTNYLDGQTKLSGYLESTQPALFKSGVGAGNAWGGGTFGHIQSTGKFIGNNGMIITGKNKSTSINGKRPVLHGDNVTIRHQGGRDRLNHWLGSSGGKAWLWDPNSQGDPDRSWGIHYIDWPPDNS